MSFGGRYLDWNQKRIKGIIDFYSPKFFYYKKVLDLGCGHADISGVLHRLGADITAVDVREEHLKMANHKYHGIKTVKADLDLGFPFKNKPFDIIIDMDLICHINNFEAHLISVCNNTTHLILETAVCDSFDENKFVIVNENKSVQDLSFNGVGCRPSSAMVERILTQCGMDFVRQDYSKYNSGTYIYDWLPKNNDECDINKRRMWFAVKNASNIKFTPTKQIISQAPPQPVLKLKEPIVNLQKDAVKKPSSPKIALCMSGHLRTFEKTFRSLQENVIKPLNCDVFIHTWHTLGSENSKGNSDSYFSRTSTKSKLNEVKNAFNPKKINIETFDRQRFFDLGNKVILPEKDKIFVVKHLGFHFSMFYSIEEAFKLKSEYEKELGTKYDYVIRIRPDIFMHTKLDLSYMPKSINNIVTPTIGQYCDEGMNDQLGIGSNDSMNIYSTLFDNMLDYCNNKVTTIRPEALLKYHINKFGMNVEKKPVDYVIVRANGELMRQV